ncbi:hypothetical protein WJX72_006299 [[Myrmecia] bisecta]|uniref:Uncharacterized protein n=1 Tax=[Myrmecia] bisecta TaxID=41462 RepID=A0AAW1Q191_9CHLO
MLYRVATASQVAASEVAGGCSVVLGSWDAPARQSTLCFQHAACLGWEPASTSLQGHDGRQPLTLLEMSRAFCWRVYLHACSCGRWAV